MKKILNLIINKNQYVLLISLILLIIGILIASRLTVETNMSSMLPKDNEVFKASYEIDHEFGGQDTMLIVVKVLESGNQTLAQSYLEDINSFLKENNLAKSIFYKMDTRFIDVYSYLYIPFENYEKLDDELQNSDSELNLFLNNPTVQTALLALYNKRLDELDQSSKTQFENRFNGYINSNLTEDEMKLFFTTLLFGEIKQSNHLKELDDEGYIASKNQKIYLMTIKPNIRLDHYVEDRDYFFNEIDRYIKQMNNEDEYYNKIEAGLTGSQMVQDYEADQVAFNNFLETAFMTFIIIIILLIISFRKLILPIISGYPLLLGTILSAGMAYLLYRHLSIFSLSFAVLLLGLGIDYAIHILSRYLEERNNDLSVKLSLYRTLEKSGKGIIIGALTTATAFLVFIFAEFKAFLQMGIISFLGIIIALITMLCIMPALIAFFERKKEKKETKNVEFRFLNPLVKFVLRYPILLIITIVLSIGLLFNNIKNTEINTNLNDMYPKNMETTQWMAVVLSNFDYNPDTLVTYANNLEELNNFHDDLSKKETVKEVSSILDILPSKANDKITILKSSPQLLKMMGLNEEELKPVSIQDIPISIRNNYIGKSGKFLIEITPTDNVWDEVYLNQLSHDVKDVTGKQIAGMPLVINEIMQLVINDVLKIGIISGLIIFIFLVFILKSIKDALITMTPVSLTLILLFGLAPILHIQFNIMNIMMVPLIIGIGVDSGVHIMHRMKEDEGINIPNSVVHVGKAIIMSAFTTLIGFGSLMFANHQGLESIGQVIVLGMIICTFVTIIVLPTLFTLTHKQKGI